jgi:hypothetical protein
VVRRGAKSPAEQMRTITAAFEEAERANGTHDPGRRGFAELLAERLPRREGHVTDQVALSRAYWSVVEPRDWLTVEVLSEAADLALAGAKWLPDTGGVSRLGRGG